ncbi:MAG TPA: hypothetical protein VLJ59_15330 [Mycobacteriales bacterium]|nr:hypothetical protein [Mycobacteriales bacterium]
MATPVLRRLLWGYGPAALGNAMDEIAIVWTAQHLVSANRAAAIAAATASFLAPGVAVNIALARRLAGVDPRTLVTVDGLTKACCLVLCGALQIAGALTLPVFAVLLAAAGASGPFGRAAFRTVLRDAVDPSRYFAANSLVSAVAQTSFMFGPALAGAVIVWQGPGVVLILDGLAFLGVVRAVRAVSSPVVPTGGARCPADGAPQAAHGARRRGVTRTGSTLVWMTGLFYLLYGPMVVSLPLKLTDELNIPGSHAAGSLGLAWSAMGIGSVCTTLVLAKATRLAHPHAAVAVVAGWGAITLLVAAAPNVMVVVAALFLGGIIFAPYSAIVLTVLQSRLSRPRFAVTNLRYAAACDGSQPLGILGAGAVGAFLSPSSVLAWTGGLLILVAAVAGFLLPNEEASIGQN